jgi:coproporphyrinogen III oxidase-like Fe-S oxidoreductase
MEVEQVTPRDFLLESLMMGLRVDSGIERAVFERRFGAGFETFFPGLWQKWEKAGWATPAIERISLTAEGRLLLDRILGEAVEALSERAAGRMSISWP